MDIVDTPYGSRRVGDLPKGCKLCVKGAKLVLLTTGICGSDCWYCPISEQKRGKDVTVANEWWVSKEADIIKEATLCDAEGAGITGGDPLCRPKRTIQHIKLLKKRFGKDFHIHLYTRGSDADAQTLGRLHDAGLDEIRFHPEFLKENCDISAIDKALEFSWDVGCEIPVIPKKIRQTRGFLKMIDDVGVPFVNLNQLELSETNQDKLMGMGFMPESDIIFAVRGTDDAADKLLHHVAEKTDMRAHYCTVHLKDGVQLKNRLKRRAGNVALPTDIITEDGLLMRGACYLEGMLPSFGYSKRPGKAADPDRKVLAKLKRLRKRMVTELALVKDEVSVDTQRMRILTYPEAVDDLSSRLKSMGLSPAIVEEYPTWDGLITDLIVL